MLMLLAQAPHFENPWTDVIILPMSWWVLGQEVGVGGFTKSFFLLLYVLGIFLCFEKPKKYPKGIYHIRSQYTI